MIKRRSIILFIVLFSSVITVGASTAHPNTQAPAPLRVAVKSFPPLVIKQDDGFSGFSIDLWNAITQELGIEYQFYEVATVNDQLDAVQSGDADAAIAGITITERREEAIDFSYPYFDSGLQIMVRISPESPLINTVRALLSPAFLQYLLVFLVLIAATAHIYWLFERRHPEFPRSYFQGISVLLWWSTLTVLGYDDRPPTTRAGRGIAIIWMFAGIFLIANLIAVLSAGATVQQLRSDIRSISDLPGRRVATVSGTTSDDYLRANGIPFEGVPLITDAYDRLLNGQVDAVVYDAPVLRYYVASSGNAELSIAGTLVAPEKYGIALPTGSPYRELINQATLRLEEDGTYQQIYQRWFGTDSG